MEIEILAQKKFAGPKSAVYWHLLWLALHMQYISVSGIMAAPLFRVPNTGASSLFSLSDLYLHCPA